jgi:hypothetical protein
MGGASAGRGFGNGTDAGSKAPRSFGRRVPNRSPHNPKSDFRAAAADPACAPSSSNMAATVTIGLWPQARPPQGHLRRAFSGLKFMAIP